MKIINVSDIDIYEIEDTKLQLILICLFTDAFVNPDELPEYIFENRGWWGDYIQTKVNDRKDNIVWGSDLWVFERKKLNDETLTEFKEAIKKCLKIAVKSGVIDEPDIYVTREGDQLSFVLTFANQEPIKFEGF